LRECPERREESRESASLTSALGHFPFEAILVKQGLPGAQVFLTRFQEKLFKLCLGLEVFVENRKATSALGDLAFRFFSGEERHSRFHNLLAQLPELPSKRCLGSEFLFFRSRNRLGVAFYRGDILRSGNCLRPPYP